MKTRHRLHAIALLSLGSLALASPAWAQGDAETLPPNTETGVTRVGTRGLNFLELGVGARALALGGAYSAVAEGLATLYWNPAGLADVSGLAATLSYQDLYEESGLSNTFVAVGVPLGRGAVGLSVGRFSSGEIQRTTEAFPDGFDPNFGSTVEWIGTAFGLHYARRVTDRLSFGVTGKLAQEGVDFANASWVGADVGTLFRTGLLSSTVALSIANLGGRARMQGAAINRQIATSRDPLFPTNRTLPATFRTADLQMPTIFRFGIRTELLGSADALVAPNPEHTVSLLSELNDAIDGPITPVLAVEYGWRDRVFVRGAKRWLREDRAPFGSSDGLSAGLGVLVPVFGRRFAFDYAYQMLDPLGASQTISVELGF